MLRVSTGFEEVLRGSRDVDVRASVLDKNLNPVPTELNVHSWTLSEDVESVPMGIFTLTVVDPFNRIDVDKQGQQSKWLSRYLKFEWGVYVTDRFEYVELFEGPITNAHREGAEVTFSACTKDGQNVDPYYFKKSFSVRKHTRISEALKAIAGERGETKLDIPRFSRRIDRDRTWAAGQEPWRVMQQLTNDLDAHQLFYRPNGYLHLRRYPEQPAWKFTPDETTILGHPRSGFDIEPLRNSAMIRGERHYKKPVDINMELDERADSGTNSIHVDNAPNAIEAGQKIVIGRGDIQETRTIDGSYTPGSRTIPLTRNLEFNHKIGAPAVVTVQKDKVKPVIGRADLGQNHPFSPETLNNGKRPRMDVEDRPGIHRKATADARAEKKMDRMRAGIEIEVGFSTLIIPHLEIGDVVLLETETGSQTIRLKNRELSSDGTMVVNRRRKRVPKKPRKLLKGPKARVSRVRKETLGGVLNQALTTSWNDGAPLQFEAITDFNAEGGSFVFEPGTERAEIAHYTTVNEDTDQLIGVTRPGPKFAHAIGTTVQEGEEPTVEKFVDGYIDDESITAVGIPVPPSKYGYLSVDTTEADEKVIQLEVDDLGELSVLEGPAGEPPQFDQDGEILPPASTLPPPSGPTAKTPNTPTNLVVDDRVEMLVQPTVFLDMSWDHDGEYTDGSTMAGVTFPIELWVGASLVLSTDTTQTSYTRLVESDTTYDVKVYARDLAGNLSAPVTTSISVGTDVTPPAVPSGVTITGGANGGGTGILFITWTPHTESDFSHVEVHSSTTNNFTPSAATKYLEISGSNAAVLKAHNGTSMTSFGYTTTVYIKLIAVDTSGNKSAASTQVSGTASQVQSADVADIQSDNFVSGSSGWRITKSGNSEFQNGTFRGTVVAGSVVSGTFVAMSSSGSGSVVLDGALNKITLGSGLILSGSGTGSVTFGSGCVIYGSGTGSIGIGTGLTLDGTGSGIITGGTIRTASGGTRIELNAAFNDTIRFYHSGTWKGGLSHGGSSLLLFTNTGEGSVDILADGSQDVNITAAKLSMYAVPNFVGGTSSSSGGGDGPATTPTNVQGYLNIMVAGVARRVPFYKV